jgi:tRNA threonylcarbamoyladenosine biosynthesis protein TsaB
MSILLSLETSTQYCSVALHKNGILISSQLIDTPRSAASQLAVVVEQLIKDAGISMKDLSGIVVASGPGSYTGLRIGVATAKGLAYALNIPLFSVNTLELMAYQFMHTVFERNQDDDFLMCPMLDARRMEVYSAVFDQHLNYTQTVQAKIIDPFSFIELLNLKPVFFFGDGADKCRSLITHQNAKFYSDVVPQASFLGEMGYRKFQQGLREDLVLFEPFYLKDFLIKKPNAV